MLQRKNKSQLNTIKVRGFRNLKNTCYLNVVIQCLAQCKSFVNELAKYVRDRSVTSKGDRAATLMLGLLTTVNDDDEKIK